MKPDVPGVMPFTETAERKRKVRELSLRSGFQGKVVQLNNNYIT